MKLVQMTNGSIVELGCGMYSTIFLHWACFPRKRRLVTYENNPKYFDFLNQFKSDFHDVRCIDDWDAIDLSEPWDIAFVDHSPESRRVEEIKRLTHAGYVVAHDAENANEKKVHYSRIFNLFKQRYKYDCVAPYTAVFSNKNDLVHFSVG
jgi:predicted O-methyltransferase YrrM